MIGVIINFIERFTDLIANYVQSVGIVNGMKNRNINQMNDEEIIQKQKTMSIQQRVVMYMLWGLTVVMAVVFILG